MKIKSYRFITVTLVLLGLFCVTNASSKSMLGMRGQGERMYNALKYAEAAQIYLKLVDTPNPNLTDMEHLAECYRKMNKYQDAEIWYARIVKNTSSVPENLLKFGEVLKANANYSKAKKAFQGYATKMKNKSEVAVNLAGCDSAKKWISSPVPVVIRNEELVNTSHSEFGVFIISDDQVYYVGEPTQKEKKSALYGWTGNAYLKIFSAVRTLDNTLIAPEIPNLPFNDQLYHVGPMITDKTGTWNYLTRTYPGKTKKTTVIDGSKYTTQNMELFMQRKQFGKWENALAFPFNDVNEYSVGHPALSSDEKILYFVSDMPGGMGGTDIWFTFSKADGSWSKPVNAGTTINTRGNELFPFISQDSVLYFSSTGHPGMGGLDIFKSKGSQMKWEKPVNLRYPINSPGDDFSFILDKDGKNGYFASNRLNGLGADDIYSFRIPDVKKVFVLEGKVFNKKNGQLLPEANVTAYDTVKTIIARQDSKRNGSFSFQIAAPLDLFVHADKTGFYPDTVSVSKSRWETTDTIQIALYLEPLLEKGKTFRLKPIYYNFDKYNIRSDASLVLDELVQTLHENPTLIIELASHTDCRGTDEYNMELSQNRAQSVVNYLVSKGIARERLVAKGYGESKLINRCADDVNCSEEEHQENRRTEFTVLSF